MVFKDILKSAWSYFSLALILIFLIVMAAVFKTALNLKVEEQINKNNTRIERSFDIGSIKCTVDMTVHGKIIDTSGFGDIVKDAMIEVIKEEQN